MIPEHIILQSAGSLSVGVVALLMVILQAVFYLKRTSIFMVCVERRHFLFGPAVFGRHFLRV